MLPRLVLALVLLVLAELMVLLLVERAIAAAWGPGVGLAVILGSILLSGALGASLARRQGTSVIRAIQEATERGEFPANSLVDGALILAGGVLLVLPGFLTDIVGFSLLIPRTRRFFHRAAVGWLRRKIEHGEAALRGPYVGTGTRNPDWPEEGPVIDITPAEESGPPPDPRGEQGQLA